MPPIKYTDREDELLALYIAKYNPQREGRQGNVLYERLCENADGHWPFAARHTWQSWRNHYCRNWKRIDKKIDKFIKEFGENTCSSQKPAASSSPRRPSSARVLFSREDDDHLVEYLATNPSTDGLLGEKLWKRLEEEGLPWVERHTWQSWRERYKKKAKWFNWAIRRYHAGDDFDEEEPPRPNTVENHRVTKPSGAIRAITGRSQTQSTEGNKQNNASGRTGQRKPASPVIAAGTRKRPRASKAEEVEEQPVKKTRVDENRATVDRRDDPGPSTRSQTVLAEEGDVQDYQNVAGNAEEPGVVADADVPSNEDDVQMGDDKVVKSEDEDESAEEPVGPVGSDDYCNEIFDSPQVASAFDDDESASAGERESASDVSEQERDEQDTLLGDDGKPEEGADHVLDKMEVDQEHDTFAEQEFKVEELRVEVDERTPAVTNHSQDQAPVSGSSGVNAASPSAHCPTESHGPPTRKPNTRIRHNEAPLVTPELSPTQEAAARHQDPQPVPRQHAKRIKRAAEGDFFGTPPPVVEGEGRNLSSPTTEAEARHHAHDRARARQPPRLIEGAFNKAFSDPRGRPRTSPSGKARRQSGVDFEDEDDVIGVQHTPVIVDDDEDHDEEHESELAQWPPVRRKSSGKAKPRPPAPATPSPVGLPNGKQRERTVTTKTVSVRTVHTVERKVDRRPKGTPFPRGKLAATAGEGEDEERAVEPGSSSLQPQHEARKVPSPASDDDMEVDADDDADDDADGHNTWLAQSHHHPFSQVPHPFSQHVAPSPVRRQTSHHGMPLPKADISRFQRLLDPRHTDTGSRGASTSYKPTVQAPRPKRAPLADIDRTRLEEMLRLEGKHAFPEPSKPSPGSNASTPNSAESASDHQESSPLADKGDQRSGATLQRDRLVSAAASGSGDPRPRVDKGKRRADRPSADAHRRYTAQDVFWQPERRVHSSASKEHLRRSLPSTFVVGDSSHLANYSALSLAFGALPFGHSRTASIPSTMALSRSVSPAKSANASLANTLPENELEMVKELGMNTALHIMARNHGFNEGTVRAVYMETGSLQLADNVLREMREGANDRASEALSELINDEERDEDEDEDAPAEDSPMGEEAEVERELTQPPEWPQDEPSFDLAAEAPLAESSRIDASHVPGRDSRKRHRLFIQPVVDKRNSSVDSQYSPPKYTRAAQHLRRERESMGQPLRGTSAAASQGDARRSSRPKTELGDDIEFGTLARLDGEGWRKLEQNLGKGAAKVLVGKSLAKLLQR